MGVGICNTESKFAYVGYKANFKEIECQKRKRKKKKEVSEPLPLLEKGKIQVSERFRPCPRSPLRTEPDL